MYRIPSARRRIKNENRLDLIPILDAVFILIFFLLMSAQFVKIYEIGSDLPILSQAPPPPKQKTEPLNLTLRITRNQIAIHTGKDLSTYQIYVRDKNGDFQLKKFHQVLMGLKQQHPKENMVVIEPAKNVSYEDLIQIIDNVRQYFPEDIAAVEDEKGAAEKSADSKEDNENFQPPVKHKGLFDQIVFGNLAS